VNFFFLFAGGRGFRLALFDRIFVFVLGLLLAIFGFFRGGVFGDLPRFDFFGFATWTYAFAPPGPR
jgi:hypothetical protein